MHSAVFIFILLVVMVTSDVMATDEQQQQQQNETDVSSSVDASNFTDDDVDEKAEEPPIQQLRRTDDRVQGGINSEQFEILNDKLLELALQLEMLQTSVDRIHLGDTPTISECPAGFTESVNSCYRLITDNLPWSIAALRCQALNSHAHLVAIDNELEQHVLDDIIGEQLANETLGGCWHDGGVSLWTAGQRLDVQSCSSPFVWKTFQSSMAEMCYMNWCPGQPNFWRGQESCAHIYASSDHGCCWNDIHCDTALCFICEIDR